MIPTAADETEDRGDLERAEAEAYAFVARFMAGSADPADVSRFKEWCEKSPLHAEAYRQARRVWLALGPAVSSARASIPTADAIRADRRGAVLLGRRALLGGSLAASAAYLTLRPPLGLWPSYAELAADYRTATGERKHVNVANISVDLNTQTSISVRAQTAETVRLELIGGEAIFCAQSESGGTIVDAGGGSIIARQASFNVRSAESEVAVSCLSGEVQVGWQGTTRVLRAQQQVRYGRQGLEPIAGVNSQSVAAWQQGLLVFEATPVAEVIDEVNRYRTGRILLMNTDIGRRQLSAQFKISEADKIISQIVHIFGAKATTLPAGVVILT